MKMQLLVDSNEFWTKLKSDIEIRKIKLLTPEVLWQKQEKATKEVKAG